MCKFISEFLSDADLLSPAGLGTDTNSFMRK